MQQVLQPIHTKPTVLWSNCLLGSNDNKKFSGMGHVYTLPFSSLLLMYASLKIAKT